MLRILSILSAYFLCTSFLYSQTSWRIDKLGVADGLSEGNIYVIHQDKKGFIWIGTHGGLNRYDGYGFRVFQYIPFNFSSLGDNAVFFLKEDSATGKFWIGGSSCLNEFDPETFTNTRYHYPGKQMEFSDGIFINHEEMLLACEYAVLLFNTRKKTFLEIPVYDEHNNPVSLSRVENAAADKKGNFMIMSKTGIFLYDPVTRSCKRKTAGSPDLSLFNQYEVFNVLQDSQGFYWIATNKKGLIRYDPLARKLKTLPLPPSLKNEQLRFDIITEDGQGAIWAGSSNGLFRIQPAGMTSEHFSADVSTGTFLSHSEVNVIYEDRNHILWIGTVGGGVNKMIRRNSGFKNLILSKDSAHSKTGTYIMALQQMGHDIWFINIWDQVGKVNIQTGQTTLLGRPPLPAGYSWYSEGAIVKNTDKELAVLNGEYQYRIVQETAKPVQVHSQASPGICLIHHAKNGRVYYLVKRAVEKTFYSNDTIYGNQFFFNARDDNQGNIWIGSSKGLIQFNIEQNQFVHYRHDDKDSNSVSFDYIYALEMDDSCRNIWMAAYNGGLCTYNMASGKFRHYSKEDGLPDNVVYSIEKDNHGNFWFSSNAGITAYNAKTKIFRNYSVADGLLNHEFNRRSSFKNDEGWLFFGGISGIDYFHPDSILKTDIIPNLSFTGFKVFNTDYIPDTKKKVPVIELDHSDRYVSVEFASLDYNDQQKIQYAYRINNNDWIKTGNRHVLSFSGLATGHHHLYIRSTNSEGAWLNNDISCLLIVHPAWWQTWWFIAGIGVLVLGLLAAGIRFYYRRKLEKQKTILEKQQAIEKERTRIATDMHDDLGAGLSRIKFLSETVALKKQQAQPIEEDISKIREYSHDMIDKMGEIVWALNEKNDSLNDLLSYSRAYAVEYLSQNGISCTVTMHEPMPDIFVSGEFRRNIYLTIKESLHNVAKHARAENVWIDIAAVSELLISIKDDGIGFDEKNKRPFSNGISNMQKRVGDIKGRLQIENDGGTVIQIRAPLY